LGETGFDPGEKSGGSKQGGGDVLSLILRREEENSANQRETERGEGGRFKRKKEGGERHDVTTDDSKKNWKMSIQRSVTSWRACTSQGGAIPPRQKNTKGSLLNGESSPGPLHAGGNGRSLLSKGLGPAKKTSVYVLSKEWQRNMPKKRAIH